MRRASCITILVGVAILGGCASPEGQQAPAPLDLVLDRPLTVRADQAHLKLQDGRPVGGVNRYEPWCELEINTVSEQAQTVRAGRHRVTRVVQAFVKDHRTRISPLITGFSCSDLVFKETTLHANGGESPRVLYLRCWAPYTGCDLGPHLSLERIGEITGPAIRIEAAGG